MFKNFWKTCKSFLSRIKRLGTPQSAASAETFTAIVHSVDDLLNLKGWMYFIPFKKLSTRPLTDDDLRLPAGFYPADGIPAELMGKKLERTLWMLKDEHDVVIARIATLALHNERIFKIVQMRYPDAVVKPKMPAAHA